MTDRHEDNFVFSSGAGSSALIVIAMGRVVVYYQMYYIFMEFVIIAQTFLAFF